METSEMQNKTGISAAELYVLLARELRRRQSRPCNACFIDLPRASERLDASGPNWIVAMPADCGGECRGIIEDLIAQYGQLYDLKADAVPQKTQAR
jgi:hypothetical protein